ncbi:MAG TPA: VRR-NUC domain-containing protein [Solirubrobacteraceae bacterium]|jgi:hypothetical protein
MTVAVHKQAEAQFEAAIVQLAKLNGWLTYHTYDSQRSSPGFPDLVLIRDRVLIVAELKSEKGHLTGSQVEWIEAFQAIDCEEIFVRVWRPADWPEIERLLGRG